MFLKFVDVAISKKLSRQYSKKIREIWGYPRKIELIKYLLRYMTKCQLRLATLIDGETAKLKSRFQCSGIYFYSF